MRTGVRDSGFCALAPELHRTCMAALDATGKMLGHQKFPADLAGYQQLLLAWARKSVCGS